MAYIGRGLDKISNVEKLDNLTFDGSSTSFALQKGGSSFVPSSANNILLSIDGVVQAGNFTVSGSTIDFGVAPSGSSTCDFILHYGVGLITTPADSSVTTAKLQDNAVTTAKLNDGSVSLAKLTATGTKDATTFLRGDNSFQEVPAGGITEADQWRLTTNWTSGAGIINSGWERVDTGNFSKIGTGMTESSGIFSFGATGIYLIRMISSFTSTVTTRYVGQQIYTTTDNSSYTNVSQNYTDISDTNTYGTSLCEFIFNVSNTSTHKTQFHRTASENGNPSLVGDTSINNTTVTFIRLGDSS